MKSFSIMDIPEFTKKEKIVVVGVIGKSPYRYPNKITPLFTTGHCDEKGIQCFWDERNSVLYLHATTDMDTKHLTQLVTKLESPSDAADKDIDTSHFLVAAGEIAIESCRILALVFHLCHIVILSLPTTVFDVSYLQLFKAIDAYRLCMRERACAALGASGTGAGAGGAWAAHGRACCPRLLFHCARAPRALRARPAALKKLEHALEDQLYSILRKTRLITNVCAKSLFAIPKNEEFVYINGEEWGGARDVSALLRGLVRLCGAAGAGSAGAGGVARPPAAAAAAERPGFRHFLQGHIDLAFGDGFDDNVGKYAMSTSFFEVGSGAAWRAAARALLPLYLSGGGGAGAGGGEAALRGGGGGAGGGDDDDAAGEDDALYECLATDVRFSKARCAKVLPLAQAAYLEGLPPHYSSQTHAHKLGAALGVLGAQARGPAAAAARRRLAAACRAAHRPRRICEAPSLTHHACILPHHDGGTAHSSGVRYMCACDCGRTRAARDDAFSAADAAAFYAGVECAGCRAAQRIAFPVFQPSGAAYREATVGVERASQEEEEVDEWSGEESPRSAPLTAAAPPGDAVLAISGHKSAGGAAAAAAAAASSTEYLPGMLHLRSPAGLLPAWAAWALVCVGPASLYSHAAGLPEHLQPGFLPHTNFLTPWDVRVRAPGRRAGKPAPAHVKVFVGWEYECARGHRHLLPGGGGSGGGGALAEARAPAAAWCPCRARCSLAVLRRLHVVTPKAEARVTLSPRVQPAPGAPVFVPQPAHLPPPALPPSTYWVLRFPPAYCDERGPVPPLTAPDPRAATLPPTFGLSE